MPSFLHQSLAFNANLSKTPTPPPGSAVLPTPRFRGSPSNLHGMRSNARKTPNPKPKKRPRKKVRINFIPPLLPNDPADIFSAPRVPLPDSFPANQSAAPSHQDAKAPDGLPILPSLLGEFRPRGHGARPKQVNRLNHNSAARKAADNHFPQKPVERWNRLSMPTFPAFGFTRITAPNQ